MEQQESKRIAISSINESVYSETFIQSQIELLPAAILLHSGWLPTKYNNSEILSAFKKHINISLFPLFKKELFSHEEAIIRILKKEKIDAVLAQYGPGGCAMLKICQKIRIPLFVHFHGFDASENRVIQNYIKSYKILFEQAAGIVVVSNAMKRKIIELGCSEDKILLNYYGPNDSFFKIYPTYSNPTFIAIGRFVEKKAPYLTLLAFSKIVKKYPHAKLIMAGDGDLLNTCKYISKSFGLDSHVSFPGILSKKEIQSYMQESLAFVQHSVTAASGDSEGTPVAILEAMAASLPVISTNHAGIPDIVINNVTGFIVDEFDIISMSNAMEILLKNKELAKNMGMAGREIVSGKFTMERYITNLRNLINNY
jgi:glycosyltransferase involved in cell wall biosynthesis